MKQRNEVDIPVSSFSDIAFLLIIFFIVVSSLNQLTGITTQIPSGTKSDAPPTKSTIVNLHDDAISLNDQKLTLPQLRTQLAGLHLATRTGDDKVVMLEATGKVPYELYYQVITAITTSGGAIAMVEEE